MALTVFTKSYGSPGDVEKKQLSAPATLTEWQEKAKEAKESKGGFLSATERKQEGSTRETTVLINVENIEFVYEV